MDQPLIAAGVKLILQGLEVDPSDHNFTDTPARYAKAMAEMFAQPSSSLTTFEESYSDFILIRGHKMYTLCPHHLFPVRMSVSIAYIPDGRVLGLSKLVRVMQMANTGPVMQERFTYAVREILNAALLHGNKGICVLVEGHHGCMQCRGVKSDASTITMAASGAFEDDTRMLDRFMFLVRGGK